MKPLLVGGYQILIQMNGSLLRSSLLLRNGVLSTCGGPKDLFLDSWGSFSNGMDLRHRLLLDNNVLRCVLSNESTMVDGFDIKHKLLS